MPKVGDKQFPYTKAGKTAAQREAKKTGKSVKTGKRYNLATNTHVRY